MSSFTKIKVLLGDSSIGIMDVSRLGETIQSLRINESDFEGQLSGSVGARGSLVLFDPDDNITNFLLDTKGKTVMVPIELEVTCSSNRNSPNVYKGAVDQWNLNFSGSGTTIDLNWTVTGGLSGISDPPSEEYIQKFSEFKVEKDIRKGLVTLGNLLFPGSPSPYISELPVGFKGASLEYPLGSPKDLSVRLAPFRQLAGLLRDKDGRPYYVDINPYMNRIELHPVYKPADEIGSDNSGMKFYYNSRLPVKSPHVEIARWNIKYDSSILSQLQTSVVNGTQGKVISSPWGVRVLHSVPGVVERLQSLKRQYGRKNTTATMTVYDYMSFSPLRSQIETVIFGASGKRHMSSGTWTVQSVVYTIDSGVVRAEVSLFDSLTAPR